jgi:hypothetical protein
VLAGMQTGVVDAHCRAGGDAAGRPHIGLAVRLGAFRPG